MQRVEYLELLSTFRDTDCTRRCQHGSYDWLPRVHGGDDNGLKLLGMELMPLLQQLKDIPSQSAMSFVPNATRARLTCQVRT